MFKILVTDDNYEDRELLKLEINRALDHMEPDIRFFEAVSVKKAKKMLDTQYFDLMTLDIQLDRMNEGLDALPELFESYPSLNIIVVSGRLNKREVSERLFGFTKDNVLKGKRWMRHFDVLDKKDNKTAAIQNAYSFALKDKEVSDSLRGLFLKAESYMEQGMKDKCLEIYKKIQNLAPSEQESGENIGLIKDDISIEQVRKYAKDGDTTVASLLFGHYLEIKLKAFTTEILGCSFSSLFECLTELVKSGCINEVQKELFYDSLKMRNRAIHSPASISERDFTVAEKKLLSLEQNQQ